MVRLVVWEDGEEKGSMEFETGERRVRFKGEGELSEAFREVTLRAGDVKSANRYLKEWGVPETAKEGRYTPTDGYAFMAAMKATYGRGSRMWVAEETGEANGGNPAQKATGKGDRQKAGRR